MRRASIRELCNKLYMKSSAVFLIVNYDTGTQTHGRSRQMLFSEVLTKFVCANRTQSHVYQQFVVPIAKAFYVILSSIYDFPLENLALDFVNCKLSELSVQTIWSFITGRLTCNKSIPIMLLSKGSTSSFASQM